MKLLNLLPQEDKFYRMLAQLAHQAQVASHALHHLLSSGSVTGQQDDSLRRQCREKIQAAKTSAKTVINETTSEVCRTFITPFDREDIQELAQSVYFIPKLLWKAYLRMEQHGLETSHEDFVRFTAIIAKQSDALIDLMHGLEKGYKPSIIHEKAETLYDLEDQGDDTLGAVIRELFQSTDDVRQLILRKDIYEMLESVTDYYRDAAAVALRINLKHS